MVGAPGGSPAEALAESAFALRASVDSLRGYESEGWAHFELTRINIKPIILRKKIEAVRQLGAFRSADSGEKSPWSSRGRVVTASRASASERSQRTFITMKVRSSYCSASRIQSFISSDSRALISLAGR